MNAITASRTATDSAGRLLREWRQRRHLSQLELAVEAEVSTRHLSFVETGRARPSRDMLLHLAELLDMPLRERNVLLVSGGFAPVFAEHPLDAPQLAAARAAVELVLTGHEPYPAMALDRHWNLLMANQAARRLLASLPPQMLEPPINMMRLSLHPQGLGAAIINLDEIRDHMLHRLRRQVAHSGDPVLAELLRELSALPAASTSESEAHASVEESHRDPYAGVIVPLRMRTPLGELNLFSTLTVFGSPVDITLSELALESFFPADEASAAILRQLASIAAEPAQA